MRGVKRKAVVWVLLLVLLAAAALLVRCGYTRFLKSVFPLGYSDIVTAEAKDNGLEPALVYSVIKAESNFDPNAQSHAGALGLMQLTPDTFDWLQKQTPTELIYSRQDLFTPKVNIRYGCRFLSLLLKKYSSERTALCAYNAGIGTVNNWLKDPNTSSDGKNLKVIPYGETKNYVNSVEQNRQRYKSLYQF